MCVVCAKSHPSSNQHGHLPPSRALTARAQQCPIDLPCASGSRVRQPRGCHFFSCSCCLLDLAGSFKSPTLRGWFPTNPGSIGLGSISIGSIPNPTAGTAFSPKMLLRMELIRFIDPCGDPITTSDRCRVNTETGLQYVPSRLSLSRAALHRRLYEGQGGVEGRS